MARSHSLVAAATIHPKRIFLSELLHRVITPGAITPMGGAKIELIHFWLSFFDPHPGAMTPMGATTPVGAQATTTTRHFFFWPISPALASSAPSAPIIWEFFYRLLQPSHRWACCFKPLAAARRHLPGHYHQLRRHRHRQRRPAETYFVDSCSYRAGRPAPSVLHQPPLAFVRHRRLLRTFYTDYSSNHAFIPRHEKANSPPPRAPQASPLAHVKGLLQRQRLRLHARCGTRTFHRRVRDPTPSTNHIELLLQPRLLSSQSSYCMVR